MLPATTSRNGLDIPFAYPPLASYVAGALSTLIGIELIELFRFLRVLFATLTIPVVYVLAREVLASCFQALLATWAFALLLRAFDWSVLAGGGRRRLTVPAEDDHRFALPNRGLLRRPPCGAAHVARL